MNREEMQAQLNKKLEQLKQMSSDNDPSQQKVSHLQMEINQLYLMMLPDAERREII